MTILNKINNHSRYLLLLCAMLIGSLAFGQKKLSKGELPEHIRLEFEKEFFKAAKEKMLGDYPEAIEDFKKAAEINSNDANTQFQLSQLYLALKKIKEAEDAAHKAVVLDDKNFWYKTQLAEVYKNQKRFTEAAKLNILIYESGEKNPQNLYDAVLLFTLDKKYSDAIKTLDKIEKQTGLNEEIVKQKEQIYLLNNKLKKAIKEVERLVNAYPQDLRYKGMLGDLLMANGKINEALDIYKKILEQDPNNGFALFAMADYYKSKNEYEPYFNYLKRAMASNIDIKSKIQEMADFVTDSMIPNGSKKSFELSDIVINSNPSEPIAHMMKGDLYIKDKNYEQARINFLQATNADPNAYAAWEQIIYCDDELKNNQFMQADCEKAVEIFPTQPRFFAYLAFASFRLKDYDKAIKAARTGSEYAEDEPELLLQLLSQMGDAGHYAKKYKVCDSAYDAALALNNANAYALNNYAYFLSLRKERLDKADSMSLRSIELEPGNPSYQDTYGWILYQKKEYKKAKEYIEKALQMSPNNAEVIEHLGDVKFKLNDKQGAMESWLKSKELGGEGEFLQRKITEKNLVE